jgi:hypothetical protein
MTPADEARLDYDGISKTFLLFLPRALKKRKKGGKK